MSLNGVAAVTTMPSITELSSPMKLVPISEWKAQPIVDVGNMGTIVFLIDMFQLKNPIKDARCRLEY